MDKKLIKMALSEAEKEAQEKTINEIKSIIKTLLKDIDDEEKKSKESLEKLKILKRDLDDIKQGRLDKIEERQEKDPKQKEISIIYVERMPQYIPMYPWQSPWAIRIVNRPYYYNNTYGTIDTKGIVLTGGFTGSTTNNPPGVVVTNCVATGTSFQNFAGGAYEVNNKIINL